jgi:zinc protease
MKISLYAALAAMALTLAGAPAAAFPAAAETPRAERGPAAANGLETIACPDDSTPLASVHLVFKAGAESLDADAAGSLSLLERLVLRGLRAAEVEGFGPLDWEGYATAESLGFSVTVPSPALGAALASLAAVLEAPPLDPASIEEEKEKAIADLRAELSDPDAVYEAALNRRLFAKYPWRRDPTGSEKSLRAATAASLSGIAAAWLAPGDAALVVGGAFDGGELRSEESSLFSGWMDRPAARRTAPPHPKPGVARPTWLAYPDQSMPEGLFSVELRYRGPDAARDPAASVAADLWAALAGEPEGKFAAGVLKEIPKPAPNSGVEVSHLSQREGGTISVAALFQADPASPAADRARAFKERVRGYELTDMRSDPSYFSKAEYEAAKARLASSRDAAASDARSLADSAAFWWSVGFPDYYAGYPAAIAALGPKDIASFVDAYVMKNLEVVAIRMNPADYGRERASLSGAGFETISPSNAFWWAK